MKVSLFFHYLYHSIIVIASVYESSLYPMNQDLPLSKNDNLIAFELVLQHGSIMNHHQICALALVNKFGNDYIKKTADSRKKYFASSSRYHKGHRYIVWHTHGSAYAYTYFASSGKTRSLCMRYHHLKDQQNFQCDEANWTNHVFPLLGAPNIFFNQRGNVCFYATGMINVLGHGKQREVIEYVIDSKGKRKKTRCVLGTKNNGGDFTSISLAQFARHAFPNLTRAVFNSDITYEVSTPWYKDTIKVFHWDGIKVPHAESSGIKLNRLLEKTHPNEHVAKN